MRRIVILIFTVILSVTLQVSKVQSQTPLTEAVDFHVKTPDGTTIYLFPMLDDDKIVVIDFFSTGCGYCQTYAPDFQLSYEDFGENQGNVFFMKINWGSDNAAVQTFDSIYGQTMPTVSGTQGGGNQVFNDYQILSYPTVIVITPDHNIFNQYIWPPDNHTIDSVVLAAGGIMVNVEENSLKNISVSLFPNPAHDYCVMKISGNNTEKPVKYDITDIYGSVLFSGETKTNQGTINLPADRLTAGTYFVRIYDNGNIFAVKRLIITH